MVLDYICYALQLRGIRGKFEVKSEKKNILFETDKLVMLNSLCGFEF